MADAANVTNTAIMAIMAIVASLPIDYTINLQTGRVGQVGCVGHVSYIFAVRTVDAFCMELKGEDVEKVSIFNVF